MSPSVVGRSKFILESTRGARRKLLGYMCVCVFILVVRSSVAAWKG